MDQGESEDLRRGPDHPVRQAGAVFREAGLYRATQQAAGRLEHPVVVRAPGDIERRAPGQRMILPEDEGDWRAMVSASGTISCDGPVTEPHRAAQTRHRLANALARVVEAAERRDRPVGQDSARPGQGDAARMALVQRGNVELFGGSPDDKTPISSTVAR